ncbi:hypothetical protein [Hymenobacter sp. PAMC 26628]|uniref:hypothetical protein n=1 Tax=Hymenobacter sp. PAMC 26628 TaxID=1484118 RepID=UPI000770519F|nr:hypothetical protein [Hymenobacter sp. PAMC 26628]AMJ64008.1 hypothetical protein AXW84_00135 [Hymenobacter sp. PAMC 26628]
MPPQARTLTPDQAIKLAQENIQNSHFITITTCLGQVDVPASFAQVGGGGITSPDGLHYSQWSNEKGDLLILFAGLGLFTYVLAYERMSEGLRQYHLQPDD